MDQMIVHVRIAVGGCVEKSLTEHQEALSEKLAGYRVEVEQLTLPTVYEPTTQGPGQPGHFGKRHSCYIVVLYRSRQVVSYVRWS